MTTQVLCFAHFISTHIILNSVVELSLFLDYNPRPLPVINGTYARFFLDVERGRDMWIWLFRKRAGVEEKEVMVVFGIRHTDGFVSPICSGVVKCNLEKLILEQTKEHGHNVKITIKNADEEDTGTYWAALQQIFPTGDEEDFLFTSNEVHLESTSKFQSRSCDILY